MYELKERTILGTSANSPSLFRPDVSWEEIERTYSLVGAFLREHQKKGKTSWDCVLTDNDEKVTLTKADLDGFTAKVVALHRCADQ
jgi:hypothetical protein